VLLYSLDIVSDEKPVIAARIFIILINLTWANVRRRRNQQNVTKRLIN
jgi:hypothetical protein